jgi:putative ABC transport system substrate-binding protein
MSLEVAAQPANRVYRIGLLWAGTPAENVSRRNALLSGLRELGWVEGRSITLEERWANGQYERLPSLAAELVTRQVDIIVANNGTPAALAAVGASRRIPIVVAAMSDPVASGVVQSLSHPGGNLTGLSIMSAELYPKRLELLKEALPAVKRVALLMNGANQFTPAAQRMTEVSARSLGIDIQTFDVRDPRDFEKTMELASGAGMQAVMAGIDILFQTNIATLGGLALDHHLPLMAGSYGSGVLISYNVNNDESYHRAASYVDKILKGAKPGDLPIEQPNRVSLIIDLKTAKALGLAIPQSLLVRADEVIQ